MELFGLAFIMYFFKLSYGSRFWRNLRNDNNILHKQATKIERLAKKVKEVRTRSEVFSFLSRFRSLSEIHPLEKC